MASDKSILSIRIPDELRAKLDEAARLSGHSRGALIKEALKHHLATLAKPDIQSRREQALEKLKSMRSAGVRLYGGRTADEIDAMIDDIRGDR